jgi:hypothetical protein
MGTPVGGRPKEERVMLDKDSLRKFSIVGVFLLSVTALAACEDEPEVGETGTTTEGPATAEEPAPMDEPTTAEEPTTPPEEPAPMTTE